MPWVFRGRFYGGLAVCAVLLLFACQQADADSAPNAGESASSGDKYNIYISKDMEEAGGPTYSGFYVNKVIPREDTKYIKKNVIYALAKKLGLNVVRVNKEDDPNKAAFTAPASSSQNEFYKRERVNLELPAINKFRFYGQELVWEPRFDGGSADLKSELKLRPLDWVSATLRTNIDGTGGNAVKNYAGKVDIFPVSGLYIRLRHRVDREEGTAFSMLESIRLTRSAFLVVSQDHDMSSGHHPLHHKAGVTYYHSGNWSSEVYLDRSHSSSAVMFAVNLNLGDPSW